MPVHVIRSPARVNLRGMHIDNNGGYTNSICVDREIFIVFAPRPHDGGPLVRLRNLDDTFQPKEVEVPQKVTEDDVKQSPGWSKYVAGAILAAEQVAGLREWPRGLCGIVGSSCPAGVGLSSSHAFVLCILSALFEVSGAFDNGIDPVLELQTAQRTEHLAGVKSGLMDQGSMIFGQKGKMLHGRFYDLKMQEIPSTISCCPWPDDCAVVVANSKVVRELANGDTAIEYALPRLGCAIAVPVLRSDAERRGLSPEDMMSWGLETTLSLLKAVPAAATAAELIKAFPDREKDIQASVQRFIPGGMQGLGDRLIPLRGSTIFTLAESARGKEFKTALEQGDLRRCGELMDVGHEGDAVDGQLHISDEDLDEMTKSYGAKGLAFIPGAFRAGHKRLDELCVALRGAGAEGASLTGAGRGGCVVGLFSSGERAAAAAAALRKEFPDLSEQDVFVVSVPVEGRAFLDISGTL
mmetsp:Transcript_75828/g.195402  ORF Transcript_75828/g.195402 Transcript_75828/m.195402 type:complete len:467 (+) Transcript_75828:283-1683(+)